MSFQRMSWKQRLQVPRDEDAYYENTRWANRDLIPMPKERRTFGVLSYAGYWTVTGVNISAWSVGSGLLALGLSPREAIGVVVVGSVLTGILAVVGGWIGEKQHIGFTVVSRSSWGMNGSYFPVLLRVFVGSIWLGLQAYWGGQSLRVLLGAIIPGFAHMKNTFSAGSHLATNDFIALVIWMFAFAALVFVRPERLQIAFTVSFILVSGSWIGLLIWAVHNAGGVGSMFHQPGTASNTGSAFTYGITAILGAWGGGTLGQSDWTRYSTRRGAPLLSQMIVAPLTVTITATLGIIVTSATKDIIGGDELLWNPITLLSAIQEQYHSSPRARAGVFFASLGLNSSQLLLAVVLNSMSAGMDMSGLSPRYINIRRGSAIAAVIGIAAQPWQLLASASKFLRVLSSFGIFVAPALGILLADYFLVRRRKLKVTDLYTGNASSIYWFSMGLNWRAIVAFLMGVWPVFPGFIASVEDLTSSSLSGWVRLYDLSFIVGTAIATVVFWFVNYVSPPPGLGEVSTFTVDGVFQAEFRRDLDEENQPHKGKLEAEKSSAGETTE